MVTFDVKGLSELLRSVVREELKILKNEEKEDRYYTIKEVSKLLKLSVSTIHRRKDAGLIPYHQEGEGIVTFHHADIERMMRNNRRATLFKH